MTGLFHSACSLARMIALVAGAAIPAQASIGPHPNISASAGAIGFPYMPPSLRSSCRGGTCVISQETADLFLELHVPSEMIYYGTACMREASGKGYKLGQPSIDRISGGHRISIPLVGIGNCKGWNILIVISSKSRSVVEAQRDEAFEMAHSWFLCVLQDSTHLICAPENQLNTSLLLGNLRSVLSRWR